MYRAAVPKPVAVAGLKHIRTRPYARTNGKAERFIQTALRECAYASRFDTLAPTPSRLERWSRHYNWHRPHSAAGGPAGLPARVAAGKGATGGSPSPRVRRMAAEDVAGRNGCRSANSYWRSQTCDLQMKATQPETSSLLPASINCIFDL